MIHIQELKLLETHENSNSGEDVVFNSARNLRRSRKRKKERNPDEDEVEQCNNGGDEVRRDPLEVFGRDIMLMIMNYLDARSVALSLLVSRGWHGVASSDKLWSPKVTYLVLIFHN